MSTDSPWIKQIELAFVNAKDIPMWGNTPPFPIEQLCEKTQELFPQFSWRSLKTDWMTPEKFLFGFGNTPLILTIELAPLTDPLFWVVAREDIATLTASLLTQENGKKGFSDPRLQEGYYRFLILELFSQINLYPGLTPRIATRGELPRETCLCYDAVWSISGKGMSGRLIVSPHFQTALKDNFKSSPVSIANTPIADEEILTLAFEAGRSSLSYANWQNAKPGDLLLLDSWSYDPTEKKGSATVVAAGIPLFKARIKHNQIKITEDAFYYEEQNPMESKEPDDEEFNLDEDE